jgi:alpha-1,2-mannosyltransferase
VIAVRRRPPAGAGRHEAGPDRRWYGRLTVAAAVLALAARCWVVLNGEGLHALVGYDPGVYYGAADALVHGLIPYRDVLLLHPPGILLMLSPFAALGSVTSDPTGMAAARLAVILLGTLNAVLVTRIALRFSAVAAVTGGAFYALWPPVVVQETQTGLQPVSNTCLLLALLLLIRQGDRVTPRAQVLAGVAAGASAGVKIWGLLPLLILLGWQRLGTGWRAAARVAAGAGAALAAICLPFFLLAPGDMFRMVVVDQLARPRLRSVPAARVYHLSSVQLWLPDARTLPAAVAVAAIGVAALVALLLAWFEPQARVVAVLLVAQTALLLAGPSYFPAYAAFVVPAAALTLAVACARVASWLARRGRRPRIAGTGALAAAGVGLAAILVQVQVGPQRPFPGSQLGAAVASQRCVLSDTPMALILMNVLSRDLRNGCAVRLDVTGYSYEGRIALGPDGRLLERRQNPAWQREVLGYLTSGDAVILARPDTGLSSASRRAITRWPVAARVDGYTVYRRPGPPP